MRTVVVVLVLLLCVLHHDVWWWDSPAPGSQGEGVVFGFLPIGLAWHTGISFAAGLVWWLATKTCWPASLDAEDRR